MNVGRDVEVGSDAEPVALVDAQTGTELARADLVDRIRRTAAALQRAGIRPGDRVAIVQRNTFDHIVDWYGVLWAGAIAVDVSFLLGAEEHRQILFDADPAVLLAEPEVVSPDAVPRTAVRLDPGVWATVSGGIDPVDRAADDPAVIAYTSGTTGLPKGVVHTHRAIDAQLTLLQAACGYDDSWTSYVAIPLFALQGFLPQVAATLRFGGRVILDDKFEAPRFATAFRRHRIQYTTLASPMVPSLIALPEGEGPDLSHIRVLSCGGAPLHPGVRAAFEARFGVHLTQGYSCTEVLGAFVMDIPGDAPPGSAGRAYPRDREVVRIVDDAGGSVAPGEAGEIVFHRSCALTRYWTGAAPTFIGGEWYATGDIGRLDERGFLFLLDRKKDVIFRGGFNIFSAEIERTLLLHPRVREATVVAMPDARVGEVPVAFVVLDDAGVSAEALQAYARERLGRLKQPEVIHLVESDALPRNGIGKVQKAELRRLLATSGASRAPRDVELGSPRGTDRGDVHG